MNHRAEELADRLDGIAEELAELAIERLQRAIGDGATRAPADERRVTRARRSVEKAAALLREGDRELLDD
jgi:hypothetical protein